MLIFWKNLEILFLNIFKFWVKKKFLQPICTDFIEIPKWKISKSEASASTSRWHIEYSKNWCYFCRRLRRTRYLPGKLAVSAQELLIPFYITASIHQRFSLMSIYARNIRAFSRIFWNGIFFDDTVRGIEIRVIIYFYLVIMIFKF